MSLIPEDVLDATRQSIDVAELIARYVPLSRSGRSLKACCPFHDEKTPSFHVWRETGTWKCFGCGKGGNAFSFLMEKEGLAFPEAARQLAKEAGIDVHDAPGARERSSRRQLLREVMEWACHDFEARLRRREGQPAVDYLKRRGITGESAREFRLGMSGAGWQTLLDRCRGDGFDEDLLVEAGLAIRRDADSPRGSGAYDRFRGRLMFPIADAQGRVIAFGARTLGDDEPKYLNSPETPLYHKGNHVYALHIAKPAMLKHGDAAVMEGYTDVVMAHQGGFRCAVAGLGTALTSTQAGVLARFAKKRVWLVYDGDVAGMRAARRAAGEFLSEDTEARVAVLPTGVDPCDLIAEGGEEALRTRLDDSREAFDYLVDASCKANDSSTPAGASRALSEVIAELAKLRSSVIARRGYVRLLANALGLEEHVVAAELESARRKARSRAAAVSSSPPRAHAPAPAASAPRADGAGTVGGDDDQWGNLDQLASVAAPRPPLDEEPLPPLERQLVEALVGVPELLREFEDQVGVEALSHEGAQFLLNALLDLLARGIAVETGALLGQMEDPELASFAVSFASAGDGKDLERQGRDCIRRLRGMLDNRRLQEELRRADEAADEDQALLRLVELHQRRAGRPSSGEETAPGSS